MWHTIEGRWGGDEAENLYKNVVAPAQIFRKFRIEAIHILIFWLLPRTPKFIILFVLALLSGRYSLLLVPLCNCCKVCGSILSMYIMQLPTPPRSKR